MYASQFQGRMFVIQKVYMYLYLFAILTVIVLHKVYVRIQTKYVPVIDYILKYRWRH